MIVGERIAAYLNSLEADNTELLEQIEREARETYVPVIRREMQSFLKTLLAVRQPKSILEVGTAVGFSALFMCEYGHPKAHITTIEKYEKRIPIARENFRRAGREKQITLLEGDAFHHLKALSGPFDFIFMDAAKGQYLYFLPEVLRLLAPGGFLVSDNVLQDGDLVESRFAVERRNRTIHSRMRDYLYELKHNPQLVTSILPLGDGVTFSVKQEREENSAKKEEQL
ncbi:MAG: O-methyltransferase [Lachnospiraceae bacterium]|jgi:predicted O-methyltransferase YrrM|nr:O-methyltransferase [Lachnospiraceae bacterium]